MPKRPPPKSGWDIYGNRLYLDQYKVPEAAEKPKPVAVPAGVTVVRVELSWSRRDDGYTQKEKE